MDCSVLGEQRDAPAAIRVATLLRCGSKVDSLAQQANAIKLIRVST
jgi:hypothetical protein